MFIMPRDRAYLNTAYLSPMLHRQEDDALNEVVRRKSMPWTVGSDYYFEPPRRVRELAARIYGGSTHEDDLAIVPSVSYAIATAAHNVPLSRGQEVVVLDEQFPSNVYSWRRKAADAGGRVVTCGQGVDLFADSLADGTGGDGTTALTAAVLDAIGPSTGVVSLPNVRWSDGAALDLVAIAARTREVGASLVLDLTQSMGVMPHELDAIAPDFACTAGYKWLLGPFGCGFLYVSPQYQAEGVPLEETWLGREGSTNFARLADYTDAYSVGAARFSAGESPNIHVMPLMEAALQQMATWGAGRIQARLSAYNDQLAEAVLALDLGMKVLPTSQRCGHYLTMRLPEGLGGKDATDALVARMAASGVHVSVRGSNMRVTPHVYNDEEDAARFLEVLPQALRAA